MAMEFAADLFLRVVQYLPLTIGAFVSILVLRFPDLTIEASWSLGGIVACLVAAAIGPIAGVTAGVVTGCLCGALTSWIFVITGRVKLLAGLVSYYILEAVGFHLLGDQASVYLPRELSRFGIVGGGQLPVAIYFVASLSAGLLVFLGLRTTMGLKLRMIGENFRTALFHKVNPNAVFAVGLMVSNAIVGLGGALWGLFYGQASNVQGIGLVLKAFLALLVGDEVVRILKIGRRPEVIAAVIGTFIFVFLAQASEAIQAGLAKQITDPWYRPTDKQIVVAVVLVAVLWARQRGAESKGSVSTW